MMRCALRKFLSNKGMSMLKAVFILMIMLIVVSFVFQVFSIFNIANNVSDTAEKSVMSLCALNMPSIYNSLREGHSAAEDEAGSPLYSLVTDEDIMRSLRESLNMEQGGNGELLKRDSNGALLFSIHNLRVETRNARFTQAQLRLTFAVQYDLEIYVAAYWNFGSITVPMETISGYSYKF